MSEAHEIAEKILESGEHEHEHEEHHHVTDLVFRRRVGVLIGALACLLAIISVSGFSAMKKTLNANIEASDTYSFYQAKVIRQQILRTASDELGELIVANPSLSAEAVADIRAKQDGYAKEIAHWESAPDVGDGKKELLAKAQHAQVRRDEASDEGEWFEVAEALLQISVVLASTSVLMASRPLLWICLSFAGAALACAGNALLGLAAWPFG